MKEIENTYTGESLRDDVCEDRGFGGSIHAWLAAEDIVELGEAIDQDKDIGGLQSRGIPEHHPC